MDGGAELNSIGNVLAELMNNPELGKLAKELKDKMSVGDDNEAGGPSADLGRAGESDGHESRSGTIPVELLENLPRIMETLGPMPGARGGENKKSSSGDMARLLRALKPYLNPKRRDAVESIITVAELGSITGLIPDLRGGNTNVQPKQV